ncbi:hypothetical protein FJU08_04705 [Martelella alba]|uniref:Uncharacterized protein n=1 Tax=Martelella alba TaxID=2590451 RepID=A0A506UCZ1_9HYPH|nr:hypothetical protein FJU08_04705 [Martelella alba]
MTGKIRSDLDVSQIYFMKMQTSILKNAAMHHLHIHLSAVLVLRSANCRQDARVSHSMQRVSALEGQSGADQILCPESQASR